MIVLQLLVSSLWYGYNQSTRSCTTIESRRLSIIGTILILITLASKSQIVFELVTLLVAFDLSLDTCCATCQIRCTIGRCTRTCACIRNADALTPYKLHNKYKIQHQYKYKACTYNSLFAWLYMLICSYTAGSWEQCPPHLYNRV